MCIEEQKKTKKIGLSFGNYLFKILNNDYFLLFALYFFSYFLIIFNTGLYWDDWTIFNVGKDAIMKQFIENGYPWCGYYYNFTFPEKDYNYLNDNKLVKFNLKISPVEKITDNFTLYRLEFFTPLTKEPPR